MTKSKKLFLAIFLITSFSNFKSQAMKNSKQEASWNPNGKYLTIGKGFDPYVKYSVIDGVVYASKNGKYVIIGTIQNGEFKEISNSKS